MYGARQQHGFIYEDYIIKTFNLEKCGIYTSKFDAYYDKIPVQIKCIKKNSEICLGDFKRIQLIDQDFILVLGFWEKNRKNIVKQEVLYIDHVVFKTFCDFDKTESMITEMKSISNRVCDDILWRKFIKKHKELYPTENIIKLRFKRDHKVQKRIQCAVKFQDLKRYNFKKFIFKI
jgi:hypothetical protein